MSRDFAVLPRDNACSSLTGEANSTARAIAAIPERARGDRPEEKVPSVCDLTWHRQHLPHAVTGVRDVSREQLSTHVDFYGALNVLAIPYVGFTEKHSIHYRGHLSSHLRPKGSRVPDIDGGSADQPWRGR